MRVRLLLDGNQKYLLGFNLNCSVTEMLLILDGLKELQEKSDLREGERFTVDMMRNDVLHGSHINSLGEWKENSRGIFCSKCGQPPLKDVNGNDVLTLFCSHCGQEMRSGKVVDTCE